MNKKNIIFIAIPLVLGMWSCSDDFLDKEPSEFISAEQITEASELIPELQAANIAGVYANMYQTGTGGTNLSHDDFGHRSYDIYTDMLSGDMALAALNYGWYGGIARMSSTTDYTNTDNYKPWRYYYRIIRGANTVIDGLGGTDVKPEGVTGKHYMGQAKAMRAYGYFYLANLFTEQYKPEELILPIYTNTKDPNQPLSTCQKVYELIVNDLTEAIDLLKDFNREAKNEVNVDVARALLAYTYATMGDYENAAIQSQKVIDAGYPITNSTDALGGFNNVASPSWLWGVDLTVTSGLDLVSWWGQVDIFTYSYASVGDTKTIDEGLYGKIPDNDIRKGQFFPTPGHWAYLTPFNKFYHRDRNIQGERKITSDYVYMRIAEMYLLNAEAHAKGASGGESEAHKKLKSLVSLRVPDASYIDALSGQALVDEIYLQTRIELWGEGKSYLAMKRNKATIVRGDNHLFNVGEEIAYDDDRLTFEIPQLEIQNNPQIDL